MGIRMTMLSGISQLKRLLETAADLSEPANYFWNRLAGEPSFQSAGVLGVNLTLKLIIERTAAQVLGAEQTASQLLLVHIAECKLWHGACQLGAKQAQIIYFDDIEKGLLTIADNMMTGPAYYVRISSVQVGADSGVFVVNPRVKPTA